MSTPDTSTAHRHALKSLIDAASEYGYAAGKITEADLADDVRHCAAANARHAADVSGEALIILLEIDVLNAAIRALMQVSDATSDFWNEHGIEIARELDRKEREEQR